MKKLLAPAAVVRIQEMLHAGALYREICAEVGCSKATVSYYAAKLGLAKKIRRHDWSAIRAYYDAGHSGHATRREFEVNRKSWSDAVKRGDIIPRPPRAHVRPLPEVVRLSTVQRGHLKRRLIREGLFVPRCAFCGIDQWRGQPLSLELDHISGDKHDNRIENLRLLCPNCHSQTATYSGRNVRHTPVVPILDGS